MRRLWCGSFKKQHSTVNVKSAYEVKKYLLLICNTFWSEEEWCFAFWNIFFRFRDIHIFVLCKWGKWGHHRWFHEIILNQEYLQNYCSSVLQTWHLKCTSQRKQNDTNYVVAMATLLAPVCEKWNIPICNLLKWDRGSCSELAWFPYYLNSFH